MLLADVRTYVVLLLMLKSAVGNGVLLCFRPIATVAHRDHDVTPLCRHFAYSARLADAPQQLHSE